MVRTAVFVPREGSADHKWQNSPVSVHRGTLGEVREFVPDFERRAFGLIQPTGDRSALHAHRDAIVRRPFREDPNFVPVGVVSKNYAFVPHNGVIDVAIKALGGARIGLEETTAELAITGYGERMNLSLYLPERYDFDPGDGSPMAMRLEIFNSVDGSTRFRALMGWFRFICSNGLIVGVTKSDFRRRHVGDLSIADIGMVLSAGLADAEQEKQSFRSWQERGVEIHEVAAWADKDVRKAWRFKAAARAYHIARTGFDVQIAGSYKGASPRTIAVKQTREVPGCRGQARNAFDVSQVLAWLAGDRRDIQEQLEWRQQIPGLMQSLLN